MANFKLLDEDKLQMDHYWFGFCWSGATIIMDYVIISLVLWGDIGETDVVFWSVFVIGNVVTLICIYYMQKAMRRWFGKLRQEMYGKRTGMIGFIKIIGQEALGKSSPPVDAKTKNMPKYKLQQLGIRTVVWGLVANAVYLLITQSDFSNIVFSLAAALLAGYRYRSWL